MFAEYKHRNLIKQYYLDLKNTIYKINSEYDKQKNSFTDVEFYTKRNVEEFKNIIQQIITFKDCKIEKL